MTSGADELAVWNRLNRLMLSSRDFQQALSAATFLYEDMDEAQSLPDWRRLRCYETNMVVAYARPFSQAYGPVKRLVLGDLRVDLDEEEQALHDRLIQSRNKLYAHSDFEAVPMSVEVWATEMGRDRPRFEFVMPKFDEGCGFAEMEVFRIECICRKLLRATTRATQALKDQFADRFTSVNIDLGFDEPLPEP